MAGAARALHAVECVQMDPLNVVARSHHLALLSRVHDYQPEQLDNVMYRDRAFFDYGGNLRIFPMHELPFWRVAMRHNVVPAELDYAAKVEDCEAYFARKALAFRTLCRAKTWASWTSHFIGRDIGATETRCWLNKLMDAGEAVSLAVEGEKEPQYMPAADLSALEIISQGGVP